MRTRFLLLNIFLLGFALPAFPQTEESREPVVRRFSSSFGEGGWFPLVAVGFGHIDQSGRSALDGDGASVQGLATYYFPDTNWLAEAGLGIQKQYFQDADVQPVTGIMSLSGRYKIPYRWSIGPIGDFYFGNGELYGTSNNFLTLLGVQALKEISLQKNQMLRLGLKFTSEAGSSAQTSNSVGILIEWGMSPINQALARSP